MESLPKDAAAGPLAKKGSLLKDTHNQLWKHKQKYSYLGNSNDLSTAVKQNSLQAYSFAARLRPGGTFQFHPAKRGFRVDLRPTLGYKINRKLVVGLGGFYRASFGKADALVANHVYGASIFARQVLLRRFFLHLEGEYASAKAPLVNRETTNRINTNGLLLGIGKSFLLTEKLNGTALWLYHFNHANTSAYQSAWGFRLGINLNQTNLFPYISNANDYLVVSYYDDYDFKSSWGTAYNYQTNTVNPASAETGVLGMETGGKVKVLGSTTWLKSVKYYGQRRPINPKRSRRPPRQPLPFLRSLPFYGRADGKPNDPSGGCDQNGKPQRAF